MGRRPARDAGNGCWMVPIPIGGHFVVDPKDAACATPDYSKPRFAILMLSATDPMLRETPEEYRQASGEISKQPRRLARGEKMRF